MLLGKYSFTPNQLRLSNDIFITILATAFTYFLALILEKDYPSILFISPLFLLSCNYAIGIYNRFKVGSGLLKATLLTTALIIYTVVFSLIINDLKWPTIWSLFSWLPLILPRILLNINRKEKMGIISTSLKNRGPVLVVGGAGYIGTHVVEQLLKNGNQVRVLDKLFYGGDSLNEFKNNPNFELIIGDATDIAKLVKAMDGVSAVVHLAGLVGDPACAVDENFTRHTNVITTRMVKEVAISFQVPRFIFASSCSVYGVSDSEVDETSELNPVSLYARTKIDSEKELLSTPDDDFNVTVLRFATVFGHSRRPRFDLVTNLFTAQGMTDGKITVTGGDQWRPFIHVRDLAIAVVSVLNADINKVKGKVYNVGDSRLNMTIGQLAQVAKNVISKIKPVDVVELENPSDRRNYAVSFKKITNDIGYKASTMMEEGISEMVEHFKKGTYNHYKTPNYSNVAITKVVVENFYDPMQTTKIYRPISEISELKEANV